MIRSNWLKDKRMECSFVTKPKQASDKYPPRTGQKANINDWKRDKYQTDNLGRDKFQRGLGQIPNTNRMSMFNFREFQTLHCSTTNKTNHSNLPCGEKMYIPNAASGYEWNRMATLSIRFYSLHLRCIVHCINSSYSKYWLRRAKGSLLKKASEPLARRSQT